MNLSPKIRSALANTSIVTCGTIEVLFFGVLVTAFFNEEATITEKISPLFAMGIFAFPIWWGLSVQRSVRIKNSLPTNRSVSSGPVESVKINVGLTLSEYRQIVLRQTYSMPVFIFLHLIGLFFMVNFLSQRKWEWSLYIFGFFLMLPIVIVRAAVKQFESAKMLHEGVTFTFTADTILCEGQNFNSTLRWEGLFKAKETSEYFFLYANTSAGMFIPKHAFGSLEEIDWFRERMQVIGQRT